jgi:hypothetical protein
MGAASIAAGAVTAVNARVNHDGLTRYEVSSWRSADDTTCKLVAHGDRNTTSSGWMWAFWWWYGEWTCVYSATARSNVFCYNTYHVRIREGHCHKSRTTR